MYSGKTADWIWVPFGVVSGVDRRMCVLDVGNDRRRGSLSGFGAVGLNGAFLTEMYSTRAWKVDSISVQTIYRWKRLFIGFSKM